MRITRVSAEDALASLRSARAGLSAAEAQRRLAEYGANRLETAERTPLALRFARQFTHFFALILWIAAGLALVAEWQAPGQGMAALGFAVVGVIAVNGAFSFWQEYRAERAIAALQRLLPRQVSALRDGGAVRLPIEALVPGDVILVEEGDDVAADCRVIEAWGLRANLATVTGEALAQARIAAAVDEDSPLRARNVLLAGTAVVSGEGRAVVYATGMRTEFGRIARLAQAADEVRTPLQREIARVSRLVALLATGLGVAFFAIGQMLGLGFSESFIFGIGIIVANVPEGLLPTVTLALALATQRMAARNVLVRHLPAVEALGSATVIVTDKTGTLTENSMRARSLVFADAAPELAALTPALAREHRVFFDIARHCHSLHLVTDRGSSVQLGDPMEVALVEMARSAGIDGPVRERRDELPFDADRKCMSTLHASKEGAVLYCKGALEALLPRCTQVQRGSDAPAPLDEAQRERFIAAEQQIAARGERVLALAWRFLPEGTAPERWEEDLVLSGLVGLEDPPRAEVPAAVQSCREAGIRVIMITGDHPSTAHAVARAVGLVRGEAPRLVTGDELAHLSDTQLQLELDAAEILFARASAEQKLRVVEALRAKGHVVAVTGDGVNDAPALRRADIGIAMGRIGTDVARESADIVLLDDNFASIAAAIEEGRAVYDNIRKFLTYILTSNIPEVVPYLAFVLARIPLPLTIIQILAVDLGTDMLPALALGAERPAAAVMQRPPRPRAERLLSWPLLARAYLWLGPIEALAAMAAYGFVLQRGGWRYGDTLGAGDPLYLEATTACLAAIVLMQVVNVFLCRDPEQSAFARGLAANRLLLAGVALELVLIAAIVYTPAGQALFGTAPLAAQAWLFMLPFAVAMLLLEEARKRLLRRFDPRQAQHPAAR
ncbi:MAG: cation-transporting P-type ATPase [Betaproteobacteria bacterium]|nr:MAG: cation-transporting P-type ATPase [Betaproteobacteria bacterium]